MHDPSTIVQSVGEYWLFSTGQGIRSWRSRDLARWEAGPRVFGSPPGWTTNAVPGFRGHIWAPEIIRSGERWLLYQDRYYLFVNWGLCCRGTNSTYNIRVGRSADVTGPYVDRQGVDLMLEGGELLLDTEGVRIGPGHAAIYTEGGTNWMSYHFYDGDRAGAAMLGIRRIELDADGWPVVRERIR